MARLQRQSRSTALTTPSSRISFQSSRFFLLSRVVHAFEFRGFPSTDFRCWGRSRAITRYAPAEMDKLSAPVLVMLFSAAAGATWAVGILLSKTTNALDTRLNLGEAMGGMVLLAIAGSLPELAITVSASATGKLGLVAGNLVGGIAVQTAVLVVCDAFASRKTPLSFLVGSLIPVLEGVLVVAIATVMLLGSLLPTSVMVGGVSPASIAMVALWLGGLRLINRVRESPQWKVDMIDSKPGRPHRRIAHSSVPHPFLSRSTAFVAVVFTAGSVITLLAGVVLATSGGALADRAGINGVIFGATFLSLATALPEISTGIAAVRLGDHQLAMGDIFGGNAFQLCLFLLADLIARKPLLPTLGVKNAWLGGLGILMTTVYVTSIVVRPTRCFLRLGFDSIGVVLVYGVGILGLTTLAR
jgi:cation:H+ antiporter